MFLAYTSQTEREGLRDLSPEQGTSRAAMFESLLTWGVLFAIVDVVLAAGVTIHAVLWKRDSRAVIGWVGLAWLAPILGACAYLCLGINRIERKAISLKIRTTTDPEQPLVLSPEDKKYLAALEREHPNLIGLARVGRALNGRDALPGNKVTPLVNGDEAFPAMIDAIHRAEHSISLLSYIFDSDQTGEEFLDALVLARQRNVEVRVLIDDVGSNYSRPNMVAKLRQAGLNASSFLPTRFSRFVKYANLRNHRKILVVDGRIAFTGGTNIRDGHRLQRKPAYPAQCLHFQIEGPTVTQVQQVFAIDWAFATGENLSGELWFRSNPRVGTVWARGVEHGPDEHFETMGHMIAAALACARDHVRIVTPYFLPNPSLIQALNITAMRGVNVEVYLPSATNLALVQWASTAQLWQLLQKGCQIFYTPPPFDHTKLMIVDCLWTLIGSTNWDPRSLRLNFEFNVECYDEQLASFLNQLVDEKARTARQVTLEEVNNRSFPVRLRDGLARLFTPYL